METSRGRWFLAEYARRHRHADTEMLLGALERLENVVRGESAASIDRLRLGLVDMAKVIAQTKAEIAALKPEVKSGRIDEATEELDSVVRATETATSDILAAAEQIQEIAWTLREQGLDAHHCDFLDERATDVYTACAFQDLTGQRTRKVIQVLRFLESRIDAMIAVWGGAESKLSIMEGTRDEARALLNGPAKPGQGLAQDDIDRVIGPSACVTNLTASDSAVSQADRSERARPDTPLAESRAAGLASNARQLDEEPAELAADSDRRDPLAALAALSYEQKIALFT